MSWGSADLVPTSRPLRSESALGSVAPCPVLLPDSESQYHSRFTESRGDAQLGSEHVASLKWPSSRAIARSFESSRIFPGQVGHGFHVL